MIIKIVSMLYLLLYCLVTFIHSASTDPVLFKYRSFTQWNNACNMLPYYRVTGNNFTLTTLTAQEVSVTLDIFLKLLKSGSLSNPQCWVTPDKAPILTHKFFTSASPYFKPFTQKVIVPPESTVAFQGDLHGDIHSLRKYLVFLQNLGHLDPQDGFTIVNKKKFYMIFLGDYVDKGNYGAEVLYTLMRLKIANPDNVFLIRGNHEDINISDYYGFKQECTTKFGVESYQAFARFYDFLPVALYLGCGTKAKQDFIQCCHGGIEIGYSPRELLQAPDLINYQWLGTLNQEFYYKQLTIDPQPASHYLRNFSPSDYFSIGFMWNDFHVSPYAPLTFDPTRSYIYGREITHKVLEQHSSPTHIIRGIFRAHQHSPQWDDMMELILKPSQEHRSSRGVGKLWRIPAKQILETSSDLWQGIVCTFLVGADSIYGQPKQNFAGFDYAAIGLLTTATNFKKWKLEIHRIPVMPGKI